MSDITDVKNKDMATDHGQLMVWVTSERGNDPVRGAKIEISYSGDPMSTIEVADTNESGMTERVTLDTPDAEYSMEPSGNQPYAEYTIKVTAPGYRPYTVSGIEVLPGEVAVQEISLNEDDESEEKFDEIAIPPHTLYGQYPSKIAESEVKPVTETGEIVLSRVVIPEYVVVHDGAPSDNTAKDYYVRYRDYVKNVASSEIYATWPDATIRANVLAIMSFSLNRVYTEW